MTIISSKLRVKARRVALSKAERIPGNTTFQKADQGGEPKSAAASSKLRGKREILAATVLNTMGKPKVA